MGQLKGQLWAWVVAALVIPGHWGHLPQVKGWSQLPYVHAIRVCSPSPVVRGEAISPKSGVSSPVRVGASSRSVKTRKGAGAEWVTWGEEGTFNAKQHKRNMAGDGNHVFQNNYRRG